MHDKKFLAHLNPGRGSMLVFDKAYNYYRQFAEWTEEGVYFVCRLKDNAKADVQETLFEKPLGKDEHGVYRVDHIHLKYKKEEKTLCLRLVSYRDEQEKIQIHHQQLGYNGGRCRLDLKISMNYRNDFVAQRHQGTIEKPESIFDRSGTNTDTFDRPFGLDVASNRWQTRLYKTQDKPQQEPYNLTTVPSFNGELGFF